MSHIYEAACTIASPASAAAIATIVTAASPRAEIREIGVFAATAVAGEVGLGRPAAAGVGALTGSLVQPLDSGDVAGAAPLAFGGPNPRLGPPTPGPPAGARCPIHLASARRARG